MLPSFDNSPKNALWLFQSSKSMTKSHLTHHIYIPLDIINRITHPCQTAFLPPPPHLAFLHHLNPQEDLHNRPLECVTWTCNTSIKAGQASETMGRVAYNVVPLPPPLTRWLADSLTPSHPPPLTPSLTHLASCFPWNKPDPSTVNVALLRVLPNVFVKDTWAVCSLFTWTLLPPSICGSIYSWSNLFCFYTEHSWHYLWRVFFFLSIKANITII